MTIAAHFRQTKSLKVPFRIFHASQNVIHICSQAVHIKSRINRINSASTTTVCLTHTQVNSMLQHSSTVTVTGETELRSTKDNRRNSVRVLISAPDKWTHANSNCGGRYQSPINIVTRKTLKDERLVPFQFDNYQQIFRGTIKNNGHSGQRLFSLNIKPPSALCSCCVILYVCVCVCSSSGRNSTSEHHLWWRPGQQLQGCAVSPALG